MMQYLAAVVFLSSVLANENKEEEELPCRLWLALSTVSSPSKTSFGLFAGIDFEKGDIIPDVELAIPFIDFFVDANMENPTTKGIVDYLETFMWSKDHSRAKFEGNLSTTPFIPGVGALTSYHSLISNAEWLSASSFLRERGDITQPGKPHLSRGAISELVNVTMVATQKIPAGMEIHPNFGDLWNKEHSKESPYQDRITRQDFSDADKVLTRIIDFYDRFEPQMSAELKESMLDFMLEEVVGAAGEKRAPIIRSLIPQNYRKLRQVKEAGGTYLYRIRDSLRKRPKWLEKEGVCVDTMYSGKSTIPNAGHGAFASRNFKEGARITLIPTILLGQRNLMNMFDLIPTGDKKTGNQENTDDQSSQHNAAKYTYDRLKLRGQQIGVNYAFGHRESSLLFLPTAPMVHFINHQSDPNAMLRWSSHTSMVNSESAWDYSVEDVLNHVRSYHTVVLELVAVKDIGIGDEIFIDYGEDWEEAWEEYEKSWERNARHAWPFRAEDVKTLFTQKPYPTESQGEEKNLIPQNVVTACFIEYGDVPDGSPTSTADGTSIYEWIGPKEYKNYTGSLLTLCDLKNRQEDGTGSYNYTVITRAGAESQSQVNNVPHSAVTVVDAPYTSDFHLPDAFRHFIGIPDELFPQNWRDLRFEGIENA